MEEPRKVLFVINSADEQEIDQVRQTLEKMPMNKPTHVELLYVKPRLPWCYFHVPSMLTLAEKCEQQARKALIHAGVMLNVPRYRQWIATGNIRNETIKLANRIQADFILASADEKGKFKHTFGFGRVREDVTIETITSLENFAQTAQTEPRSTHVILP